MKMIKTIYVPQEVEVDVKFRIVVYDTYCDPHFQPSPPFYPLKEDFDTKEEAEQWKKENEEKYFGEVCIKEIY